MLAWGRGAPGPGQGEAGRREAGAASLLVRFVGFHTLGGVAA